MKIRATGEDAYFAASNSSNGFCSYYGECFDHPSVTRLYAIKGGPGTGKGYFLRAVARRAEEEGWRVEYIYCSSDPDSLDGLRIFRDSQCIALIDATAPHVYEPMHPGIREEIVNLGAFWNSDLLLAKREEIEKLQREKKSAYERAYRYLAGVDGMTQVADSLVAPYIKREKIATLAERLAKDIPNGSGFSSEPALIHSIGMKGRVGFDTYFAQAKRILRIEDCRGAGQYLMAAFGALAPAKGWRIRVSHDPILPDRPDGIFLCESGTALVLCSEEECLFPHKQIRMRRFVETARMHAVREDLNHAERMKRAMLAGAITSLDEVRVAHFQLESLYSDAMDFSEKEAFTREFCEMLFSKK